MRRLLRTRLLIVAGVGALAVFGAVGAFASTDTLRSNTPAVATDPIELPPQAQQEDEDAAQQLEDETLGVPEDSDACENLGCDWVETPDGIMKYLPQPAVDGINRARGNRERAQELAEQARENGLGNGLDDEPSDLDDPEDESQGPPDWAPGPPPHAGADDDDADDDDADGDVE